MQEGAEATTILLCAPTLGEAAHALSGTTWHINISESTAGDLERAARADRCFVLLDADTMEPAELAAVLTRCGRYANTVAVVFSADPDPKRVVAALRGGAADYIVRDRERTYLRELGDRLEQSAGAGPPKTPRSIALSFARLAHTLYHDAKNPVNNILGFAELLIDMPGTKLSAEQAQFMIRVRSNGYKLLEILEDFLRKADQLLEDP